MKYKVYLFLILIGMVLGMWKCFISLNDRYIGILFIFLSRVGGLDRVLGFWRYIGKSEKY